MECQEPNPGLDYLLSISHRCSKNQGKYATDNPTLLTFFILCELLCLLGRWEGGERGGLLFYYEPKQAVKSSPFLSRNIILPPEGAIVESAPSRPNLTRPEVNGPGGAGWPGAPEPSRHTTGRGCRHPPVKRLLPAVVCGVFFFFSSLAPIRKSLESPKKRPSSKDGKQVVCQIFAPENVRCC